MTDIDLEKVMQTLANTPKDQINLTYHTLDKISDRDLAEDWIFESLNRKKPQGILKQDSNKFKLHYNHPAKKGYDLIIVIAVISSPKKIIRVVTAYEQTVKRRLRI
ncbi:MULTISPECIES: hypothetical protein [Methanobacterium]|uniref:DUF4258 domain-containing protein n=1 Tax=Methanobacterium veterum TaxID=408577 RepID=A0A9E5DP27_9EURY|nr:MULTISPECIES: hypothetical protein [Methanobacterium]MCZ3366400.1 hypothetical protein [Methanobacterium veterum]MCZ3371908.1 hypothetical protein [Methanobacterium veterum]